MTTPRRCAVCFDPRQSTRRAVSRFSPSASKPARLVERLQAGDWPLDWLPGRAATERELGLAHELAWVRKVLRGKADNGFGNRLPELAATLPWTVGSLIAACEAATPTRPALSPTSGFHHAGWAHAAGFCTFNGLVVAARLALARGARKVAILDADAHYGDGTDEILDHLDLREHIEHWTLGSSCRVIVESERQTVERAFELNSHLQPRYLELIAAIPAWLDEVRPDLLIYQAGADPHVDDPYGGVLTSEELALRDRSVFEAAWAHGIPVAWNLAGGYQTDLAGTIAPVLELHVETLRAACGLPSGLG
jgi:acetoin utilization deacetylase AcuC-like enzyme